MRKTIAGRYYNSNGVATAIVAVVTYREDGSVLDWAGYIGGTTNTWAEDLAYEVVAERGCKLSIDDACYYFGSLPRERYRP